MRVNAQMAREHLLVIARLADKKTSGAIRDIVRRYLTPKKVRVSVAVPDVPIPLRKKRGRPRAKG